MGRRASSAVCRRLNGAEGVGHRCGPCLSTQSRRPCSPACRPVAEGTRGVSGIDNHSSRRSGHVVPEDSP